MVDTSGEFSCGNERIIGAAVRSVQAVESLYVTVLGSAAYIGIVEFNVPLDTLLVISETVLRVT